MENIKHCIDCEHCEFKSLDGERGTSCSALSKSINGYDDATQCDHATHRVLHDCKKVDSIKGAPQLNSIGGVCLND